MKNSKITNAVISVTNKCNSKCEMCNIWKSDNKDSLIPQDFLKLPSTLKDINITGGEPFLRTDIVEIVENICKVNPKVKLCFSSNGFLTKKITKDLIKIQKINPKISISLSLDGIGEMHSNIRGIDNAYQKVLDTVESLQSNGISAIRFAFTISKHNISHLSQVYDLSQKLNIELTASLVHNSDNYYNIQTNQLPEFLELEKHLNYIILQENKSNNPRRLLRNYYFKGILDYAKTQKRPLKCYAIDNSFFMDANGDVFPCNILTKKIGNIKTNTLDSILNPEKINESQKICLNCNKCWTVCNVKNSIFKHPIIPIKEVIKMKTKSFCSVSKNPSNIIIP